MSEDSSKFTQSLNSIRARQVRAELHKQLMKSWKRGHSTKRRYVLLAQLMTATVSYYASLLTDAETSLMDRDAMLQRKEQENMAQISSLNRKSEIISTLEDQILDLKPVQDEYDGLKIDLKRAQEDIDRLEAEKSALSLKLAKSGVELRDTRKAYATVKDDLARADKEVADLEREQRRLDDANDELRNKLDEALASQKKSD